MNEILKIEYDKTGKIFSHVRKKYLVATPEEIVRQNFLLELVNNYKYELDQIAEEESVVGRGSAQARADFLIWKNKEDSKIRITHQTPEEIEKEYIKNYGEQYAISQAKITNNINKPILSLFTLPKYKSIKTELLFIERCIDLLKPDGKLAIVLPEMFFSDIENLFVREYIEDNAKILSVVSLPEETFVSSKATVKTSILFIKKFSETEKNTWDKNILLEKEKVLSCQKESRDLIAITQNKNIERKVLLKDEKYLKIYNNNKKEFSIIEKKLNAELRNEKKIAQKQLKQLDDEVLVLSRINARKLFDYSVFLAEVEHSGITSTGSINEDENQLPLVIADFNNFNKTSKTNNYISEMYSELGNRWDVKSRLKLMFPNPENYPLVKISKFLTRNKTSINILNDVEYKRVTIKISNQGIFLRDKVIGNKIGTKKQFSIKPGQFLLSKIDAKSGAFGVVPDELDSAIITGNFWTFDVNTDVVNPRYFSFLTNSKGFLKFCQMNSIGTTNRKYLQEDLFINFEIPLPEKTIQDKIIEGIEKIEMQIKGLETQKQNELKKYFK